MTIQACVAAASGRLQLAGLSPAEADLSARVLAEHVLGWETAALLSAAHDTAPDGFRDRYEPLVARRAAREPLPYITGSREFWGLDFEVSPAVLIPRPESELIVEASLDALPPGGHAHIADACTGSGILAVSLARERPGASVVATDISAEALEVARRNAARHLVAGRVALVRGDLLTPVAGPFELIVCNPPYVAETAQPALQPEVRDHEPAIAIFGGADGLQLLARMIRQAPSRLTPGGFLIFEFGFGQDVQIEELIAASPGLELAGFRRDLQGIARTCIARRT
ncbi:MAG: peptide chain release factor N(5)-glutamine methyltransferase [Acidobacteria bacterium]|nr:peptide chain release factor N(5)-glutamine methyltransferase [Acidobacteriota bacterium]